MLKVRRNNIFMTRGDTVSLRVELVDYEGDPYYLKDGDVAIFRMKRCACNDKLLIEKEMDVNEDGEVFLCLDPEDTEFLKFGLYSYEIEVVTAEDYHFTVIDNGTIEIGKELENHERSSEHQ